MQTKTNPKRMGGREDKQPPKATEAPGAKEECTPAGPPGAATAFPIHEPIGRQLRAIFEEVTSQPVPDKFLKLLEQLERKSAKD